MIKRWSGHRTTKRLVLASSVALVGVILPVAMAAASAGSAIHRNESTTSCASKAVNVNGCWTAPAGYVPAPKGEAFTPIPVQSESAPNADPAGSIGNQISPPFPADALTVNNSWWDTSGDATVTVYAGALGDNDAQGAVIVTSSEGGAVPGTSGYSQTTYPTTSPDGPLTITSTNGWVLTLTASDGAVYEFDVSTDRYA